MKQMSSKMTKSVLSVVKMRVGHVGERNITVALQHYAQKISKSKESLKLVFTYNIHAYLHLILYWI